MACTACSLKLLEIGRFVSGSRCNRFGSIARGLGQFDGIIRVPRFPERCHLFKRVSEFGGVAGGSAVVGRIADRPDRRRYGEGSGLVTFGQIGLGHSGAASFGYWEF